jgi:hypothetical protein
MNSLMFNAKHDNVMIDSRIMLKFVIVYYILLYISFYFFHQSADVVEGSGQWQQLFVGRLRGAGIYLTNTWSQHQARRL